MPAIRNILSQPNNIMQQTGTPAELSISIQPKQYLFTCNGSKTTLQRHCNSSNILGYKLYPYFGGDETAPHDIDLFIKEL